jgi:hypothetical protein
MNIPALIEFQKQKRFIINDIPASFVKNEVRARWLGAVEGRGFSAPPQSAPHQLQLT